MNHVSVYLNTILEHLRRGNSNGDDGELIFYETSHAFFFLFSTIPYRLYLYGAVFTLAIARNIGIVVVSELREIPDNIEKRCNVRVCNVYVRVAGIFLQTQRR